MTIEKKILELAVLKISKGREMPFEKAFAQAKHIISGRKGFISLQLQKCREQPSQYLLLVEWQSLEDHTIGFRQSEEYKQWRDLLHSFYDPFPIGKNYSSIM